MISKALRLYKNRFTYTACQRQIGLEVDQNIQESQATMLIHVLSQVLEKEQDSDSGTKGNSHNGWKEI